MSHIEERVIDIIRERMKAGKAKYGVGMDRGDLTISEWVQHLKEELLDAAIYAEKMQEALNQTKGVLQPDQEFYVEQRVEKVEGYLYPGIVVAAFKNLSGKWRYVVECTVPETKGMLHIYNAKQLKAV